tara:strand:- start:2329 stop:2514 length:186 start_codon:yes stop_codon:yes gene_type:complete
MIKSIKNYFYKPTSDGIYHSSAIGLTVCGNVFMIKVFGWGAALGVGSAYRILGVSFKVSDR